MASHGELEPMPDAAIFADTHNEPKAVYRWLDWLEKELPFPVIPRKCGRFNERGLCDSDSARKAAILILPIGLPVYLDVNGGKGMGVSPMYPQIQNRCDPAGNA